MLYIAVSRDKYELPEAVADTIQELAQMCGATANSISSYMCHARQKGWTRCKYIKVEEGTDDGDQEDHQHGFLDR